MPLGMIDLEPAGGSQVVVAAGGSREELRP